MESGCVHGSTHPALVRALKRLLRPLVRLLIREGLTFTALSGLLKEVYVRVAEEDFATEGRPTDSRITLLTGVHRKDVRRLRSVGRAQDEGPPAGLSLSAQIIAMWAGSPDFSDEAGALRPLPRVAEDGPSFESLVTGVSKDIRPRAVLDDWLDRGIAHLDPTGRVVLAEAALVPREDVEEIAFFLGRNLHDHIAACDHNLADHERPFIERAVYYDGLTPQSVARLAALARDVGMESLLTLNREANALAERDQGAADAGRRMSFGVYFYAPPQPRSEEN